MENHKKFMDLANEVSLQSKDTNRKVGSVIVNDNGEVVATGFNHFPEGVDDTISERYEKPDKYFYTEHAERGSLHTALNNSKSVKGCTMYINSYACHDCARAIIETKIKKVVCSLEPDYGHGTWGSSWKASSNMLKEAGVEVVFYKEETK